MSDEKTAENGDIPGPVDGKFVFQVDKNMRIRFNADGWVEEIGKGGNGDPLGTILQGKPATKLDDVQARRYYDLYSRTILLDIYPKNNATHRGGCDGLIRFQDLEPGSHMHTRVNKAIEIANHYFNLGVMPLSE